MKNSPLQLSAVRYSDVVIRAVPEIDQKQVGIPLPVQVDASIFYGTDGEHYATLTVHQKDDSFPYLIEVSAFAMFGIDTQGCAEAYKQQFNPAVIGVNVARLVYASVRDMIASITARAPYESATIPTLIIEPKDVSLNFESGEEEKIYRSVFAMNDEQLEMIRKRKTDLAAAKAEATSKPPTQKKKRAAKAAHR